MYIIYIHIILSGFFHPYICIWVITIVTPVSKFADPSNTAFLNPLSGRLSPLGRESLPLRAQRPGPGGLIAHFVNIATITYVYRCL